MPGEGLLKMIVRDPVCGGLITWENAATILSYHGVLHYLGIRKKSLIHAVVSCLYLCL